jgi:hypothetical protein
MSEARAQKVLRRKRALQITREGGLPSLIALPGGPHMARGGLMRRFRERGKLVGVDDIENRSVASRDLTS